jgi:aspartyl-tRNA(Asn)/glutamyl-tRNA(Gln) amidotransferase subunit A
MRKVFLRQMLALFEGFDVMVTPETVPAGEPSKGPLNPHSPFNDTGFPGMAVPAGFSSSPEGLPLSIQIVGKPFDEETVYAVGFAFESETRLHERPVAGDKPQDDKRRGVSSDSPHAVPAKHRIPTDDGKILVKRL